MTSLDRDQTAASRWVRRFAALVPRRSNHESAVLDIAAGSGRHARLFLEMGHAVMAIDRDMGGLLDLRDHRACEIIAHDLEEGTPWPFATRRFAGIIVTNYLWRPLLAVLPDLLAPGGVLIYETFAQGNERFGRPSNPAFLLRPGELLEVVRGRLEVVAYEHGEVTEPRPAIIQRICAVRGKMT
jgi:SAM-dependent methyltransferase